MNLFKNYSFKVLLVISLAFCFLLSTTSAYAAELIYSWSDKASMPDKRAGAATVEYQGKLYVFGGTNGNGTGSASGPTSNTSYVYDPATDQWDTKQAMPTARSAASAVVLNNKIYVLGGYNFVSGVLTRVAKMEIYDPETNIWTTGTNLTSAKAWVGTDVYDGKIYVFGGTNQSNANLTTVESYNPLTNGWTTLSPIPSVGGAIGVAQLEGKFYVSGFNNYAFSEYNPQDNSWTNLAESPNKLNAPAVVIKDSDIYFFGSSETSLVNVYNTLTNTWGTPFTLSSLKFQVGAVLLNKDIYVVGGTTGKTGGISSSLEKLSITEKLGRAILVITMTNGIEKEYDLSMSELNNFIEWYDNKDAGIGKERYGFNKTWNMGPFKARTEYIVFDKILTFEVNEYDVVNP
ncbi:Kelch repeat-containing protein [Paenibacillus sinopodophylli]|uniref:Kelch repeat-containing protein n=1 Tax=Paenibacillus sinopodophylli TaxID=1837342 RepID=UPI00110CF6AE|nr:kelch repeat-containing protein [Paenibacillus sinopodophylli]